MNVICLVIDRLHAGYLGCYGNAWVGTPGFDRLACDSFLFDQAYVDCPTLESLYRSFWLGWHASCHQQRANETPLPELLQRLGVSTTLLSDEPAVTRHPLAAGFEQCTELKQDRPVRPAKELEESHLARFFAAAVESLERAKPPFFHWLHSQGMDATWDAPWELREQFADKSDPPPPTFLEPPRIEPSADADPDMLLGVRQAYAGQISLLDSCLETFLDWLDHSSLAADTLLCVLSARGIPLGVHGRVGQPADGPESLHGELTHVPWLMRFPHRLASACRSQALVQPPDLTATLQDWLEIPSPASPTHGQSLLPIVRGEAETVRDRACIASPGEERALRTPAWYARFPAPDLAELYTKPDDRWEMNDVSSRCSDVVDAMRLALSDWGKISRGEEETELPPLDEILVTGLD